MPRPIVLLSVALRQAWSATEQRAHMREQRQPHQPAITERFAALHCTSVVSSNASSVAQTVVGPTCGGSTLSPPVRKVSRFILNGCYEKAECTTAHAKGKLNRERSRTL